MATKNYLAQCSTMRSSDEITLQQRSENLRKIFAKVEKVLGGGPFFKGADLSNVDIAWLPLLHRAYIISEHTHFNLLAGYPKTQNWQKSLIGNRVTSGSVAIDFETAFTDFYLSNETFLGRGKACSVDTDALCASGNCC